MKNTLIQKFREVITKNQFLVLLSKSLGHEQLKGELRESTLNCLFINLKNIDADNYALLGIAREILAQTHHKVDMEEATKLFDRIFKTSLNPERFKCSHVISVLHGIFEELDNINELTVFYLYPVEKVINLRILINFLEQIDDGVLYSNLRFVLLLEPGTLDSVNLQPFRFVPFDNLETKNVYISYKWNDVSKNIVFNQLVPCLGKNEIPCSFDLKDCSYMQDIAEYEHKFRFAEKVIIVLCSAYLFSPHCMYEMACVFDNIEDVVQAEKVLLLDVGDFEQSDTLFQKLERYWHNRSITINAKIEKNPEPENRVYKQEMECVNKICLNLSKFWQFVNQKNALCSSDLLSNNCEILINRLGYSSNITAFHYDEHLDIEGS